MIDAKNSQNDPDDRKNSGPAKNVVKNIHQKNEERDHEKHDANPEKNPSTKMSLWQKWKKLTIANKIITVCTILIAVATVTYGTVEVLRYLNEIHPPKGITESEGAYIAIGRKDGVVAEFVMTKAVGNNAGIVIYFQNTGHLTAKFNWGLLMPATTIPPSPEFPLLEPLHHFKPMTRTRNRKDGSTGESGGQMIPVGEPYAADAIVLPAERVTRQMKAARLFTLTGAYEYCDSIGTYSCRLFDLYWQGEPFNRFSVTTNIACPPWFTTPERTDPDVEYLFPCERQEQ
jgi:hypothetical protein